MIRVVLSCLLAALAGLGFGPVFGGFPLPFIVAVSAAAGVAAATAAVAMLAPKGPAAVVVLAGTAAVAGTVAVTTRPGLDVLNGPWLLLTGALPAEPGGPGLAAAAALAGWTCLAAGLLATYSTNVLLPLLPSLGCLLAALGLGASGRPLPGWFHLAAVALTAAVLVTGRRTRFTPAAVAAASVIGVVAVLTAGLIGPAMPGVGSRRPADARELVHAPVLPRTGISPLQQYLALRNGVHTVRLSGMVSHPVNQLRMVTLTRFDGTYWTVDADYRRAGTTLPAPTTDGTVMSQEIDVDRPGPLAWLPTAGRPRTVSVPGLGVDEATGDLTVPTDHDVPRRFTATSVVHEPSPDQIRIADPVRAASAGPELPPQLRAFADAAASGQASGSAVLLALKNRFTDPSGPFRYDRAEQVAGGHGLYHVGRLLQDHRGTSEQYASAFAVMARHLGYDARVVMGFRVPRDSGPDPMSFKITERDVDAWVEVDFEGLGWVHFDPSPRDNPIGTRPDDNRAQPAPPDPVNEATEDQINPPTAPAPVPATEPLPAGNTSRAATALWLAVLLLALLAVPVTKSIRRSRRKRGRTRAAVFGAWQETLDRLREIGVRLSPALTTSEVARLDEVPSAAAPQLASLATLVDHAGYAPEEPEAASTQAAWATADEVRRLVFRGVSPFRRLRALVDPRPLLPNGNPFPFKQRTIPSRIRSGR